MANANAKPKPAAKKEPNRNRRNGKAWKLRPCGNRHAPDDGCRPCEGRR